MIWKKQLEELSQWWRIMAPKKRNLSDLISAPTTSEYGPNSHQTGGPVFTLSTSSPSARNSPSPWDSDLGHVLRGHAADSPTPAAPADKTSGRQRASAG